MTGIKVTEAMAPLVPVGTVIGGPGRYTVNTNTVRSTLVGRTIVEWLLMPVAEAQAMRAEMLVLAADLLDMAEGAEPALAAIYSAIAADIEAWVERLFPAAVFAPPPAPEPPADWSYSRPPFPWETPPAPEPPAEVDPWEDLDPGLAEGLERMRADVAGDPLPPGWRPFLTSRGSVSLRRADPPMTVIAGVHRRDGWWANSPVATDREAISAPTLAAVVRAAVDATDTEFAPPPAPEPPAFGRDAECLVDDVIAHRDEMGHIANATPDELRQALDVACARLRTPPVPPEPPAEQLDEARRWLADAASGAAHARATETEALRRIVSSDDAAPPAPEPPAEVDPPGVAARAWITPNTNPDGTQRDDYPWRVVGPGGQLGGPFSDEYLGRVGYDPDALRAASAAHDEGQG